MKLGIVGNGSLGLFMAAAIHKADPNIEITMAGPQDRPQAASAAAGLMLNIFSEIDAISSDLPLTKWKLQNSFKALDAWRDFFGNQGFISQEDIFTTNKTVVYLPADSTNDLEKESFRIQKAISKAYGVLDSSCDSSQLNNQLPHEPSADAAHVLLLLDNYLSDKIKFIDKSVQRLDRDGAGFRMRFTSGEYSNKFDTVIVAAGANSTSILDNSKLHVQPSVKCFYGVGSALNLTSELDYVELPKINCILRSPNRGGTCGLHLVQRKNSLYVGASSVVSRHRLSKPRAGSVATLLKGCEEELGLATSSLRLSLEILTGYRPVTQDAVPLVGYLEDNLICCYGHKRDGFTWAPYLSGLMKSLILGESIDSAQKAYLDMTYPVRTFSSFGSRDKSFSLFLENEKYSRQQHGQVFSSDDQSELTRRFRILHSHPLFAESTCHPELLNVNYSLLYNSQ